MHRYDCNSCVVMGDMDRHKPETQPCNDLIANWTPNTGTVSYTHLDVYKRQVKEMARKCADEEAESDQAAHRGCLEGLSQIH